MEYSAWMDLVDEEIARMTGLSHEDLPDQMYMEWFMGGIAASEAATMALEDEGFPKEENES